MHAWSCTISLASSECWLGTTKKALNGHQILFLMRGWGLGTSPLAEAVLAPEPVLCCCCCCCCCFDWWCANHKLRTPSNDGECHIEWQSHLVVWHNAGSPMQSGHFHCVSRVGLPTSLQYWHRCLDVKKKTLPCQTRQSEREGRLGWVSGVQWNPS